MLRVSGLWTQTFRVQGMILFGSLYVSSLAAKSSGTQVADTWPFSFFSFCQLPLPRITQYRQLAITYCACLFVSCLASTNRDADSSSYPKIICNSKTSIPCTRFFCLWLPAKFSSLDPVSMHRDFLLCVSVFYCLEEMTSVFLYRILTIMQRIDARIQIRSVVPLIFLLLLLSSFLPLTLSFSLPSLVSLSAMQLGRRA